MQKKMKLNLDALSIESFEVLAAEEAARGTVQALESETDTRIGPSCRNCPTEGQLTCYTCVGSPDPTCGGYCTDYVPSCHTCP